MIALLSWTRRRADRAGVLLLAALAYLPAFASAPGRVPADTKVYLYLDPGRLLADSLWSWDDRQFAGWVPHQTIGYLWPSGPWFWTAQHLGLPDWVAHRLWIGSILFAAGLGVRWCARRFGLAPLGALLAAVVYQLSPFVLPYISRTSVLLLPFAGLGWLVGLTMSATRRGGWRDVALFALVIATVGGINATAMVMIAPAPLLWILDAATRREITWRRAGIVTLKLGGASIVVSLWWLMALAVQALFGAPVLNYTETLGSVTFTSVSTEALRGLGYWLFYVRDQAGPLTSMSLHYQVSTVVMFAGFAVIVAGLLGLTVTRWRPRRFLTLSLLVGIVLAVGAHPIDDPSPLGRPLADSATSTLTLALRSSTRAVPLAILAIALGAGALVGSIELVRPRLARVGAVVIALAAFVNLPAIRQREFVDPVLAHPEEMPEPWRAVADALDSRPEGYRTFQLPGTESAVARWGQTVDPILPGMTERSVVQRDWLPLGSAPAMDLFYALDDGFQTGTLAPDAIAPVARWFGADSIVVAGDVAFDRFRTARPELTWATYEQQPAGLGDPVPYGPETVNVPAIPMVDDRSLADPRIGTAVPETALVDVESPAPIVTARTGSTLVVGSGAGVVSAAGAGVLNGDELLRYAAALDDEGLSSALAVADQVVVTDSNRKQAHQWRGSQDALGYVERADEESLRLDPADHRLPLFADQTTDDQTVAVSDGPVVATATSYGEAAALRPEDRPAMAIDGDPSTSWSVADRGEPIGERLRLDLGSKRAVSTVTISQTRRPDAGRRITRLQIGTDEGTSTVDLDDSSSSDEGQVIDLGVTTASIEFTIAATDLAPRANYAGFGPVGLSEIRVDDLAPSPELLRLPTRGTDVAATTPLTIVTERWRTDPTNRRRDDPERSLDRRFDLATDRTLALDVTTRLSRRAPDDVIGPLLSLPDVEVSSHLAGAPMSGGWSAFDGDSSTAWTTAFGEADGASITVPLAAGTVLEELAGSIVADDVHSIPTELTVSAGDETRRIALEPGATTFTTRFEPLTADRVTVTVSGVEDRFTIDRRFGEPVALPVAFGELQLAGAPAVAWPDQITVPCRDDLVSLDGVGVPVRLSGVTADLLRGEPFETEPCGDAPALSSGTHDLHSTPGVSSGLDIDRVVLRSGNAPDAVTAPPLTVDSRGRGERRISVGPCPDGCWVVSGDGWNTGWVARIDGIRLADPEAVDGGFNGWYLPPGTGRVTVDITWSPQRRIWAGLAVSVLAVIVALAIVLRTRRRVAAVEPLRSPRLRSVLAAEATRSWIAPVAAGIVGVVGISPGWGLVALSLSLAATALRRPAVLGIVGVAVIAGVGAFYVEHQRNGRFLPGFGWIVNIESTHRITLVALVLIAAGALSERGVEPTASRR